MGNTAVKNSVITIDCIYEELKKAGYGIRLEWLNDRLFIKNSGFNFEVGKSYGFILINDVAFQKCDKINCLPFFRKFLDNSV